MLNQTSYKFMVYDVIVVIVVIIFNVVVYMSFVPFISILCISIRLLLRDRNIYNNNNNTNANNGVTRIDPSSIILRWYQFYRQIRK